MKQPRSSYAVVAWAVMSVSGSSAFTGEPAETPTAEVWKRIEGLFKPPPALAGDLGDYRSPLRFAEGRQVQSADQWLQRRREILRFWHQSLGSWPPVIQDPTVQVLKARERDGLNQKTIRFPAAPQLEIEGYLLIPPRRGPRPAVLVVYYDAETGAGLNPERKLRDFGYQLARRGFVTLSIGWPRQYTERQSAQLQPLSCLAYIAANCYQCLAELPEVDPARVGVVGHSFGGKWALFASCLYDKFACAAYSDPGIVFDETRPNVNYWEPWYLGWQVGENRRPGVPTADNPRTGAYKQLVETGHDLHELLALMPPRPLLVSGGAEDRPERWQALNHVVAINRLLGYEQRVAMSNRLGHGPTEESNEQLYSFFEYFLQP
jgi:hypothetical protein